MGQRRYRGNFPLQPHWHGPFDIIGDLHGCAEELHQLLEKLGYRRREVQAEEGLPSNFIYQHPEKRQVIFLGDLVDRGPRNLDVLSLVMSMVRAGVALCVLGNHDDKFLRKLKGNPVKLQHGLEATIAELDGLPKSQRQAFSQEVLEFLETLPVQYVLDDKRLVVAHAGLSESLHGKAGGQARSFALYGKTTGERDEYGLPVRVDWAQDYRGEALVVYGHTPVPEARFVNNTINLDTGCVFGGALTALRYPERELVSVPANEVYYQSPKPFPAAAARHITPVSG